MYRDGFWTVSRTDSILRSKAACVMHRMLADPKAATGPRLAAKPLRCRPELRQIGRRATGEVLVCRPPQSPRAAVGHPALERPAGDGHQIEQFAGDGAHPEAGPEHAEQLDG